MSVLVAADGRRRGRGACGWWLEDGWGAVVGWLKDDSGWVEFGLDFRLWKTLGRIGRGGRLRRWLRGDCEEAQPTEGE